MISSMFDMCFTGPRAKDRVGSELRPIQLTDWNSWHLLLASYTLLPEPALSDFIMATATSLGGNQSVQDPGTQCFPIRYVKALFPLGL